MNPNGLVELPRVSTIAPASRRGTFGARDGARRWSPSPFLSPPWVSPPLRRTSGRVRRSSSRWWMVPPRVFASTAGCSPRAISPTRAGWAILGRRRPHRRERAPGSRVRATTGRSPRARPAPARATATSSSPTLPAPASAAAAPRSTSCFACRRPSATRGPPGASSSSTREATASAPPPTEPWAKPSANSPWTPPASASQPPSSRRSSSTSRTSPPRFPGRLRLIRRRRPPDGPRPPIDERVRERVADGILALGHASPIEIGVGHGVFACDRTELTEFVRRHAAADANDANDASLRSGTLACLRCLQKPSEAAQRDAGAVMPSPAAMGLPGGGGAEWVLTDSAFHVGWRACDALVRVAAAEPRTFAGVEVCAYGDFMQPMGEDADDAYLGRVDHVASLAGSAGGTNEAAGSGTDGTGGNGGTASAASAPADPSPAGRLRAARASLARALRGKPLLVLPLLPSRFVHVGTMPELLQHCARDHDVLAALPAAPGGVALGSWDPACMEGVPGGGSVGADGVWGGGRSSAPGSCLLASTLGRGARGRGVAHRALRRGQRDRRGRGMPPARRRRAQGIGRPPGDVFALRPARRRRRRRRGNRTRRRTVRSRELFRRIHRVVLDVPRAGRDGRGETPGEEYPVRGPG